MCNFNNINNISEISKIIYNLKSEKNILNFLLEILTESEVETLSKRWHILKMLANNVTQRDIAKILNVSLCKVTRGAKILKDKNAIITNYLNKGE